MSELMQFNLVWIFLGLGILTHLGARKLWWSYGLVDWFWWASIWAASDDSVLIGTWFCMVLLGQMSRNDFPSLRMVFSRRFFQAIGKIVRAILWEKGNGFQRYLRYANESWMWTWGDSMNASEIENEAKRCLGMRREKFYCFVGSELIALAIASYIFMEAIEAEGETLLYFVAGGFMVTTWSIVKGVRTSWMLQKSIVSGLTSIRSLKAAEQGHLFYTADMVFYSHARVIGVHLGALAVFGFHWTAFSCIAALVVLTGFEKKESFERDRFLYQELWDRRMEEWVKPRSEIIFLQKFRNWIIVYMAAVFALLYLVWLPILMHLWEGLKQKIWKQERSGMPQVVCFAAGLNHDWDWGEEKALVDVEGRMRWAWLHHHYYFDVQGNRTALEILNESDGAIITVDDSRLQDVSYDAISSFVGTPFRHLSVLRIGGMETDQATPRSSDDGAGALLYFCSVIDEPIFNEEETRLGELVELEPLSLNINVRKYLHDMGVDDYAGMYQGGVMELNILHRRVHEFAQPATRFLELLNLWELMARWVLVLKNHPEVEGEQLQLSLPFGKVFDLVRNEPIMKERLNPPEQMMSAVRQFWRQAFNWKGKMSNNPSVAEVMSWMIYIRNKTRGHGSTSRIHPDLYQATEGLTALLFLKIRDSMSLEILVLDEKAPLGIGTIRRGMQMKFVKEGEVDLGLLPPSNGGVCFRQLNQGGDGAWKTSNLLKAFDGHVFILNDMKKGHREWVCFSTGELIRPETIFDV